MVKRTTTVNVTRDKTGTSVAINGHPITGAPAGDGCANGVTWSSIPVRTVIAALPSNGPLPLELFAEWLANGERGLSSEAIVQRLTGTPVDTQWDENGVTDHPRDPSDFRRCVELLKNVPEARPHLHLMADVSPQWARLVAHWADLENLLAEEEHDPDGHASRLYRSIQDLTEGEDQ